MSKYVPMSIPLDRLYHFIENVADQINQDHVLIYRFWPHGTKNINNLCVLKRHPNVRIWPQLQIYPQLICNDQEPLNFDFYQNITVFDREENKSSVSTEWFQLLESINYQFPFLKNLSPGVSIYKKSLLLHSEQRSSDVSKYQQDRFIPVYYWSHGFIAQDWFRFARHITQHKQVDTKFLIYNRAWSGTREYRLKFSELLIQHDLVKDCKTKINPVEPELDIHYSQHKFSNQAWQPTEILENYFAVSTAKSYYSADFDIEDYEATDIEVVLETLFDDGRLHLTEKSLRPIACGQPFILAATHGSLQYLRSYGFKTFEHVWDESYDLEIDPVQRLRSIVKLMQQIAQWTPQQRQQKLAQAQIVTDHNKKHFFSHHFTQQVAQELENNLKQGFHALYQCNNFESWIKDWEYITSHQQIQHWLESNSNPDLPNSQDVDLVKRIAVEKLSKANAP
jgi:hypothetical protein